MQADPRTIALQRFGLGARPGDLDITSETVRDVQSLLLADVSTAQAPEALAGLADSAALYSELLAVREARKAARLKSDVAPQPPEASVSDPTVAGGPKAGPGTGSKPAAADVREGSIRRTVLDEISARIRICREARIGFGERLALFWANHFTVSATNATVRVLGGAFEREAIRPHLTGRFSDMLAAAESHPAMLIYLDNARSMGPDSSAGQRRGKGLNENLAREILELHTVGVDGGYTQADVTTFAEAITGWSVVGPNGAEAHPGQFVFRQGMHEPGAKHVLGRDYVAEGRQQGQEILGWLAVQPSTANHIAYKLVRHFIADAPPAAAVDSVAQAFLRSSGELMAVYEALLSLESALALPATKLRLPIEYVYAGLRALDLDVPAPLLVRSLTLMGQPPGRAPSPQGWSDDSEAWTAPDGIRKRLELAQILATRSSGVAPLQRAKAVLGGLLSEQTGTAIAHAETVTQALVLLLMSPEFQRR